MASGGQDVVLVTGQQFDCTRDRFDRFYAPVIERGIDQGCHFILGVADGVDKMTLDLLVEKNYKSVTLYVKGENDCGRKTLDGWTMRSGFPSYPKRDEQMCKDATRIIVYLFDEAAPTGTFYVLLLFFQLHALTNFTPELVRDLARVCQRDTKHSKDTWHVDGPLRDNFTPYTYCPLKLFLAYEGE